MSDAPCPIEIIARGLLRAGDSVLLCRNVKHAYTYLPGGHVEPQESAADALAREFLEETGLTVGTGELMAVSEARFIQKGTPRHEVSLVFHVEHHPPMPSPPPPVPSLERKIEFLWAAPTDLAELDLRPSPVRSWLLQSPQPTGTAVWLPDPG